MSYLELAGLEKIYPDGTRAVRGIDLAVDEGEFVVLLGPSGCGKTTTLRMVAGLEIATAGSVRLAGEDVTRLRPARRDVGMVFQFYALYPHLSVAENIAFPLRAVSVAKHEARRRAAAAAERFGIAALLDRHPGQLSGGDQQRVSLARAMVRTPRIWLMDEPLGTLDSDRRLELREEIRRHQLELGVTTLYVTHDQEEAMSLADRIVVMEAGRIGQVGAPLEVYDDPADRFVAHFVGSPGMNCCEGEIEISEEGARFVAPDGSTVPLPGDPPVGPATFGLRGEHLRIADDGPVDAEVLVAEYLGSHRNLHCRTALGEVIVRAPADHSAGPGDALRLRPDPARIRCFDADGRRIL